MVASWGTDTTRFSSAPTPVSASSLPISRLMTGLLQVLVFCLALGMIG